MTARTKDLDFAVMHINTVVQLNPQYTTSRYALTSEKVGVRRLYQLQRYTDETVTIELTEKLELREMKLYLNGILHGLYATQ